MDEGLFILIFLFLLFYFDIFHAGHSLLQSQQHYVITATLNKQITSLPPIFHFTAQCSLTLWTSHTTTSVVQPVCQFLDHCITPLLWLVYHLPTIQSPLPVWYTHIFLCSYLSWIAWPHRWGIVILQNASKSIPPTWHNTAEVLNVDQHHQFLWHFSKRCLF